MKQILETLNVKYNLSLILTTWCVHFRLSHENGTHAYEQGNNYRTNCYHKSALPVNFFPVINNCFTWRELEVKEKCGIKAYVTRFSLQYGRKLAQYKIGRLSSNLWNTSTKHAQYIISTLQWVVAKNDTINTVRALTVVRQKHPKTMTRTARNRRMLAQATCYGIFRAGSETYDPTWIRDLPSVYDVIHYFGEWPVSRVKAQKKHLTVELHSPS